MNAVFARASSVSTYVVARATSAIASITAYGVVARVAGLEDVAAYVLCITAAGLIGAFGFQWVRSSYLRFGATDSADEKINWDIAASLGVRVASTVVVLGAALMWVPWAGPGATLMAALVGAGQGLAELGLERMRVQGRARAYLRTVGARSILALPLVGVGALWFGWLGAAAGYAASYWGQAWLTGAVRITGGIPPMSSAKGYWTYGGPLTLAVGASYGVITIDRFAVMMFVGGNAAIEYIALQTILQTGMFGVMLSANLALFPDMVRRFDRGESARKLVATQSCVMLAIGACCAIMIWAFGHAVLAAVFGIEQHALGRDALALVTLLWTLQGIRTYGTDLAFQFLRKTATQALIATAGFVVALVLCWPLAMWWGWMGVATASVVSVLTVITSSVLWLHRNKLMDERAGPVAQVPADA
jgi:O-antigen/teichoic acid export membrane protein